MHAMGDGEEGRRKNDKIQSAFAEQVKEGTVLIRAVEKDIIGCGWVYDGNGHARVALYSNP